VPLREDGPLAAGLLGSLLVLLGATWLKRKVILAKLKR
jgi:hypothetical protein